MYSRIRFNRLGLAVLVSVVAASATFVIAQDEQDRRDQADPADKEKQAVKSERPIGLIVASVRPDSPAAKAGIKPGDRLLSYDRKPLPSRSALQALRENTCGKNELEVRLRRKERTLTVIVPRGKLGISCRGDLLPAEVKLYKELHLGYRSVLRTGRTEEAITKTAAAARTAEQSGRTRVAAWLWRLNGRWLEGRDDGKTRSRHIKRPGTY